MTLGELYPPIAAATIVNVFLFAWGWRSNKSEARTGEAHWGLIALLTVYGFGAAIFAAKRFHEPALTWIDVFATAAISEGFGGIAVYAILHAWLFSRGQSWKNRAFAFAGAGFLTLLMFAGLFTGR